MGKLKYIICFLLVFVSCNDNEEDQVFDENVIINQSLYNDTNTDSYSILNVSILENILTIEIGSSGCGTENWKATLVDSEAIAESQPPQRFLKLNLENNEACLAYFTKQYSFNVSALQVDRNQVAFNLDKWNNTILYNY